jgi:type 1 glutamine amidotransferase
MVITEYGKGRVYHHVLGHVWEGGDMRALENEGFRDALVRGCEWAATGDVT